MTPRSTVELDAVPGLRPLYARALAQSAAAIGRPTEMSPDDLPDTTLLVRDVRPDVDRLTAYQQLVGEPVSDDLPAGFVHVLAFPVAMALMAGDGSPLPMLGMVHVANRVTQRRGVRLGESLDIRVHMAHLRAHRRGVTVDVVAEALADDDVVWHGVSTYLAKGARIAGEPGAPGVAPAAVPDVDRPEFTAPAPTGAWRITADVARRYAAVSGDPNPIHTSRVAARAFGFPRRIAHGMYTAARALADVGPAARGEEFDWEVTFARPVLLPSTVTIRIAPGAASFELAAWDPRSGKPHLTGAVRQHT